MTRLRKYLLVIALPIASLIVLLAGSYSQDRCRSHAAGIPLRERVFDHIRPLFYKPDTMSVIVIGDMMMHSRQLQYDYNEFLLPIKQYLWEADLAIANMEFTLAGEPYSGYPSFSAPDGFACHATDCGIDIFLAANNHIMDKGESGIKRTIAKYDEMKCGKLLAYTGIAADEFQEAENYPLMVMLKGIKLALVNFTYGTNNAIEKPWPKVNIIDKDDILKAIGRAKDKDADFIIALPHWGIEYQLKHSPAQEELAQWLAENGVDIIIGSHPHVVQDSTTIITQDGRKVPVFYSIGNAISNMSATNTRLELAVSINIARNSEGKAELIEPSVKFLWCTLPGKLFDNFGTIAVKDYIDRKSEWMDKSDYDNMMATYRRVKDATGIID